MRIDATEDPDTIDWIARSRDEREEDEKALEDADHRPPQEVLDDPDEPTTNTLALKERVEIGSVHDAPRDAVVHADPDGGLYYEEDAPAEKQWAPYQGPQGGEGWRNLVTDEVVYQDEPPGETIPEDELRDVLDRAGLEQDEIQNIVDAAGLEQESPDRPTAEDVNLGDRVRIDAPAYEEGHVEGEVVFNDQGWVEIELDDGRLREFEAENLRSIVESDEGAAPDEIREGYGSYNEGPPDTPLSDYQEAVERLARDEREAERLTQHMELADESPVSVITEEFGFHDGHGAIKEVEREARLSDNSAPDHLDPSNAEEVVDLNEASDSTGISASAMDVAEMPDGSEVYITYVGERATGGRGDSVENPDSAEKAVSAARAMEAMGVDVPDHHYEHNRFYAVEGVEGDLAWEADENPDKQVVNPDQAADALAAGLLVGNRDQHTSNAMVVDGELVPIDLDMSADDATGWGPGSSSAFQKAGQTLLQSGGARDVVDEDDDDFMASQKAQEHLEYRAGAIASVVDPEEVVEDVPNEEMAETIKQNIEHFAEKHEEQWG